MAIFKYYDGYYEARQKVLTQPLEDDLKLIGALFGRGDLDSDATAEEVKREALRQLEIEFRDCVNEEATAWVEICRASSTGK